MMSSCNFVEILIEDLPPSDKSRTIQDYIALLLFLHCLLLGSGVLTPAILLDIALNCQLVGLKCLPVIDPRNVLFLSEDEGLWVDRPHLGQITILVLPTQQNMPLTITHHFCLEER